MKNIYMEAEWNHFQGGVEAVCRTKSSYSEDGPIHSNIISSEENETIIVTLDNVTRREGR
jgi:hypothetical protein